MIQSFATTKVLWISWDFFACFLQPIVKGRDGSSRDGQIWREKLRDFKNIFPARGNAASASSGLRPAVSLSAKLWAVWAGKKTATTQLKILQKFAPFGNFIKG